MNLKSLSLAVAALAGLSAVAFFATRPSPPPAADNRLGAPLIDRAAIEAAQRIRISDSGRTVELARAPDGTWVVPSYHDFPADFSKLARLMDELGGARLERLVTSSADRIARLEFNDTAVRLLDSGGQTISAVTFGRSADGGGRFVRLGDENRAFLTRANPWLDAEARSWADPVLVKTAADQVASVEIGFAGGESMIVKRTSKDEAFNADRLPAGRALRGSAVSSLVSTLSGLRFTDTAATDAADVKAARDVARTFTLTTFDGRTVTIRLGRRPAPPAPEPAPAASASAEGATPPPAAQPGPAYAFIQDSAPDAVVNRLMERRAFQVADYVFTSLPETIEALLEPAAASPSSSQAPTP